mmetsp:Transcript_945/g.3750  ORF Transcript_945/g.3750 Transcript_945/m.3750 type:complete len:217 (-) Transcript_945:420-1070(-)
MTARCTSVERPGLDAVADELGVDALEEGPAELEAEAVGDGLEVLAVVGREAPAERAERVVEILLGRRADDRDDALADDPVERDLRDGFAVPRADRLERVDERLHAGRRDDDAVFGREPHVARAAARVVRQRARGELVGARGRREEASRERIVRERLDAELLRRVDRRLVAALVSREERVVDLIRRERDAEVVGEEIAALAQSRRAVIRHADLLDEA